METKLLYAENENCIEEITKAAEILKNGGLVAIPTETVYGLAASAYDNTAVKNIFAAKGRPCDNPLIVHIADKQWLNDLAINVSDKAKKCMDAFWPGPFTAVVPKSQRVPKEVSGGLNTVAVRMPSHRVALEIIKKAELPLAAPSANSSGLPSPTTANHVVLDMMGKIDAIVVSNDCEVGVESTVVTFAVDPPRLLRPGGITVEMLREIIPDIQVDPAVTDKLKEGEVAASPGMKYKHYSPKAEVYLAVGSSEKFVQYCNDNSQKYDIAVCFSEEKDKIKIKSLSLGGKNAFREQAEKLFQSLRNIDEKNLKTAIVHAPAQKDVGLAVYNRLVRAAGYKVIEL